MTGNGRENNVTPKMIAAIMALLSEPTLEAAATKARVSVRTIRRWRELEVFRDELKEAQRRALDLAVARAQAVADEAVETLVAIHKDESQPANARVAAARALDARRWKAHDVGDMSARIEELESLYKAHGQSGERGDG
jgi:uncharacterized protein YjiS (DUF1127 family)